MNHFRSAVLGGLLLTMRFGSAVSQHVSLMPQLGMSDVTGVAYSPDGHFVAMSELNKTVRLWSVESGLQVRAFTGHGGSVQAVAYSPDGKMVLSGSDDHTARLWDVGTGKVVRTFSAKDKVRAVTFSSDGKFVLTGGFDHKASLWETDSGKLVRSFEPNRDVVSSVAMSFDGQIVVTGDWGSKAKIWNASTGELLHTLEGHTDYVYAVAISPDGKLVATGGGDNMVRVWSAKSGELLHVFKEKESVNTVSFSHNGKVLATGTNDATTQLWDVAAGKSLKIFPGRIYGFKSVAFSSDDAFLLAGCADGSAWEWDTATGALHKKFSGQTSEVTALAFSPDNSLLAVGQADRTARLWDMASGQAVRTLDPHVLPVTDVAFSPSGKEIATSGDSTRVWNVSNGELVKDLNTERTSSVGYLPDGRHVVTSFWQGGAKTWDVASGKLTQAYKRPEKSGLDGSVAYSADGKKVAAISILGTVTLWDASGGGILRTLGKPIPEYMEPGQEVEANYFNSVVFSPDSKYVLTGQGFTGIGEASAVANVAKVWNASTGEVVKTFAGHTGAVTSAKFSKDGRFIITGSVDQTARIWDAVSGSLLKTLAGHSADLSAVTFSANGHFVLTGSADTTTRLWNVQTGTELAAFVSFSDGSWAVTDPSGRFDTNDLDGGAPLAWVLDQEPMRAISLEVFLRDYYTPGLLARVWRGEVLPGVEAISKIKNRVQPEVHIVAVKPSATVGRVDVQVHAASYVDAETKQASGLQDLRLFRDGRLVAQGYRAGTLKDGDYTFQDVMLPGAAGKVEFTAYAFNDKLIKSKTATLVYETTPSAVGVQPHAYLVQVGVNHYAASGCELRFSGNDAETTSAAFKRTLEARGMVVEAVLLESVAGGDATGAGREAIHAALKKIAAKATPDDVFFMSFSGHGYGSSAGNFYILPSDFVGTCAGMTVESLKTAISADELAEWLRPIDAGEMTLVLDACQSAESVQTKDFKPGPLGSRGLGQLAYDKRMRILAASQATEEAMEYPSLKQGVLSYVLTHDGLQEGKADWKPVDHRITVGEWLAYAANAVPKFVPAEKQGNASRTVPTNPNSTTQIPALFDFSKTDGFVLQ